MTLDYCLVQFNPYTVNFAHLYALAHAYTMQYNNRGIPRRPLRRPELTDGIAVGHILNSIATVVALILSIVALALISSHINNNTDTMITTRERLSLYGDVVQLPENVNTWTDVYYNKVSKTWPSAWLFVPGSSTLLCRRAGTYTIYYSLQSYVPPPTNETPFACKACQVWIEARAILQSESVDSSVAFTSPANGIKLTTNVFTVTMNEGDRLQIQFKTHCPQLVLTNMTHKRMVHHDEPLPSVSILVY